MILLVGNNDKRMYAKFKPNRVNGSRIIVINVKLFAECSHHFDCEIQLNTSNNLFSILFWFQLLKLQIKLSPIRWILKPWKSCSSEITLKSEPKPLRFWWSSKRRKRNDFFSWLRINNTTTTTKRISDTQISNFSSFRKFDSYNMCWNWMRILTKLYK